MNKYPEITKIEEINENHIIDLFPEYYSKKETIIIEIQKNEIEKFIKILLTELSKLKVEINIK
jgi:putative IMPACT (imprinted ancient) family translation regulator